MDSCDTVLLCCTLQGGSFGFFGGSLWSRFFDACKMKLYSLLLKLSTVVYRRSDLTASSGMASTLQLLASSSQWQPSVADHVGLCLERLAEPTEVSLVVILHYYSVCSTLHRGTP